MKVRDVMRPAITIDSKQKVSSAVGLMADHHSHSLIVTSGGKIIGCVSEDEVLENLSKLELKVTEIMVQALTIDDDEELSEAAEIMNREDVQRLAVLKGSKLVGVVTVTDLIANAGELSEIFLFD